MCTFFDIWTSRKAQNRQFLTLLTWRHLNFQKWSDPLSFLHFWLGNVLRATRACTFSTSQLPKEVWTWCVGYILTWKCASRQNGVHALARLLFHPLEPQIIEKTQRIMTFLPFREPASSFFTLLLLSDLLSSFSSPLWLFPPLLNNCPYCRKFDF